MPCILAAKSFANFSDNRLYHARTMRHKERGNMIPLKRINKTFACRPVCWSKNANAGGYMRKAILLNRKIAATTYDGLALTETAPFSFHWPVVTDDIMKRNTHVLLIPESLAANV